ncbi:hypothetical protein G2W53_021428 [Senna tora]|uniref:Uncharacterized protein n=1 Tax=Senna tora TaxID=362788 RepID=A0A834TLE2_9FABA|nr:hypothetical protein G2W53_021428 [Senna tora]
MDAKYCKFPEPRGRPLGRFTGASEILAGADAVAGDGSVIRSALFFFGLPLLLGAVSERAISELCPDPTAKTAPSSTSNPGNPRTASPSFSSGILGGAEAAAGDGDGDRSIFPSSAFFLGLPLPLFPGVSEPAISEFCSPSTTDPVSSDTASPAAFAGGLRSGGVNLGEGVDGGFCILLVNVASSMRILLLVIRINGVAIVEATYGLQLSQASANSTTCNLFLQNQRWASYGYQGRKELQVFEPHFLSHKENQSLLSLVQREPNRFDVQVKVEISDGVRKERIHSWTSSGNYMKESEDLKSFAHGVL